jgi:hypothetical protein
MGHPRATWSGRWPAASWSASPAFLSYTDEQIGRLSASSTTRVSSRTPSSSWCRTTERQRRRGPRRLHQRHPTVEPRPGHHQRDARADRRDRWTAHPQQLSVGLDHGGQHALQAMEARGPSRRRGRPLHRLLAGPAVGVEAVPIRHQFAHAIDIAPDRARAGRYRPAGEIEYVPQTAIDGVGFGYLLERRRGLGARAARDAALRDARLAGASTTGAGRRSPSIRSGPLYGDGLSPNAPFDEDIWELYHVAEDLSETRDLAAEHPERVADMVELWWQEAERNQVLPARQPGALGAHSSRSPIAGVTGRPTATSPAGPRSPNRWPSTCATVPTP